MNPYRPPQAAVSDQLPEPRGYARVLASFISSMTLVPTTIYAVAFVMLGDAVQFSLQSNYLWTIFGASAFATAVVYPFRMLRPWIAAVAGYALGLVAFSLCVLYLEG